MSAASSGTPSGAGLSFFRPSMAFVTIPFFGLSLAGRSNRTTGTFTLTRCAAICAPITPAPRTATLRTGNRFMVFPWLWRTASLDADPCLRAAQHRHADVPAHLELLAAFDRAQTRSIDLSVLRVGDVAALPPVAVA